MDQLWTILDTLYGLPLLRQGARDTSVPDRGAVGRN